MAFERRRDALPLGLRLILIGPCVTCVDWHATAPPILPSPVPWDFQLPPKLVPVLTMSGILLSCVSVCPNSNILQSPLCGTSHKPSLTGADHMDLSPKQQLDQPESFLTVNHVGSSKTAAFFRSRTCLLLTPTVPDLCRGASPSAQTPVAGSTGVREKSRANESDYIAQQS